MQFCLRLTAAAGTSSLALPEPAGEGHVLDLSDRDQLRLRRGDGAPRAVKRVPVPEPFSRDATSRELRDKLTRRKQQHLFMRDVAGAGFARRLLEMELRAMEARIEDAACHSNRTLALTQTNYA